MFGFLFRILHVYLGAPLRFFNKSFLNYKKKKKKKERKKKKLLVETILLKLSSLHMME
jgi:hypothetical protein